jgi:hypothetical protein
MLSAVGTVRSNPAVDFLSALAQNEIGPMNNLAIPKGLWQPTYVVGASIVSMENLAYEVWLYSTLAGYTADPATDTFLGMFSFQQKQAGDPGQQVTLHGGALNPLYRYSISNLVIPYVDQDYLLSSTVYNARLHARLVCRSPAGKQAGAAGALALTVFLAQQGAQA